MRNIRLIILAAMMVFATACSSSDGGSRAESAASETAMPDNALSGISSAIESNQESETSAETPEISSTITENKPEPSADKEENALSITITANGRTFSATLYDNETAREFKERLPLTLDMSELNGNEKFYYLPESLPKNSSRPSKIHSGDIMLYGSDCLVIFYETFSTSYSYTPIGKIDDPDGLAAALGSGEVQVAFG